jgi:transcriptional regulator of acetoin/glycerol metabolism
MRLFRERLDRSDVEGIDAEALKTLVAHAWPGNLRELINVIERAMLLCRGGRITRADLPAELGGSLATTTDESLPLPEDCYARPLTDIKKHVLELFERRYLIRLLERTGGRVGETAAQAGIASRTLYEKMKQHGLHKEDYR